MLLYSTATLCDALLLRGLPRVPLCPPVLQLEQPGADAASQDSCENPPPIILCNALQARVIQDCVGAVALVSIPCFTPQSGSTQGVWEFVPP